MKTTMKKALAGLLILSAAACATTTEVQTDTSAAIAEALTSKPVEVTLEYGEYARVVGARLGVTFTGVSEDSRCPSDVTCVWAGDGVAQLELTGTGQKTTIALHTTLDPKSQAWNGAKVTLLELSPAPRAAEPTRPDQYMVKLRFEAAER